MVPYPIWSYFPRNVQSPAWVGSFVDVVAAAEKTISTVVAATGLSSDEVLNQLAAGLQTLGYAVETGKAATDKIKRPVLFGDQGQASVSYEIDAFNDGLGVAVEVEAGRAASNNAEYRNIVRTSLILDARYLAMLVPVTYRSAGADVHVYNRCRGQLDAIYASRRLRLPFDGVLLVGY
jgi:hypothetical protein